jgi:hypothetical protein
MRNSSFLGGEREDGAIDFSVFLQDVTRLPNKDSKSQFSCFSQIISFRFSLNELN